MLKFRKLFKSQSGATAIEYGLIAALVSVAVVSGSTALGTSLNSGLEDIETTLTTANP